MKAAISAGYRHIDGAFIYSNEEEVGEGVRAMIKDGVVKREDLFIVSKVYACICFFFFFLPQTGIGTDVIRLFTVCKLCLNSGTDFHVLFIS